MSSVTIVFDTEDISKECLENWVDDCIERGKITASFVSKVLINNKTYLDRDEILNYQTTINKLKEKIVGDKLEY